MTESIGFILNDSARLYRRAFNARVKDSGITALQWRLITYLKRHAGIRQGPLAELIEVEPITLTRIVDRMEEAGWVERVADPKDRRARLLHPTDKSREIVEPLRAIVNALVADMAEGLTKREQDLLAQLLERISANLSAEREFRNVANG